MKWRKLWFVLALTWTAVSAGCGSHAVVTVTLDTSTATVIIANQEQFTATVAGSTNSNVNWCVVIVTNGTSSCTIATSTTASGNATFGTIDTSGLYTAPAIVPNPDTVTITVAAAADTSATASATVTVSSGISVTISPTSVTVGTSENFPFTATVTGTTPAGCAALNLTLAQCESVTWCIGTPTASTTGGPLACPTTSGEGTINTNSGLYQAPSSIPTTGVVVSAISVADATVSGSGSVEIINAVDPTVSSVTPNTAPQGGLFQDIYLTGTHFISTTSVLINGVPVATPCVEGNSNTSTGCFSLPNDTVVSQGSSTTLSIESTSMRVRLPDFMLSGQPQPPATTYSMSISVERQGGLPQTCPTQSQCVVTVTPVRPAIVGPTPDSTPQGTGSALDFNIDGGYYGTAASPTVTAQYNGQIRAASITSSTRQMGVTIGGSLDESDFSTPGLYPVTLQNSTQPQLIASTNLAVRPAYGPPATTQSTIGSPTTLAVGSQPSAVVVDRATGTAIVANQGSNSVDLIDMTQNPPVVVASICTATIGDTAPCTAQEPATCPSGVAVDSILNLALVVNTCASWNVPSPNPNSVLPAGSIAVINLQTKTVSNIIQQDIFNCAAKTTCPEPISIGVNSVTGQGIVVYKSTNSAGLICLTQTACPNFTGSLPAITGIVTSTTGPNSRVAVEPNSNWAVVTPGGLGTLTIADLGQQTEDVIVSVVRTSGTVTVTTSAGGAVNPGLPTTPTGLQVNQPVLITGIPDGTLDTGPNPALNGVFTVASVTSANSYTFTQTTQSGGTPPNISCSLNSMTNIMTCTMGNSVDAAAGACPSAANPTLLYCGFDNYSSPIATITLSTSITGIAINSETREAVLTDPLSAGDSVTVLNLLDQTTTGLSTQELGSSGAAFNQLTNMALVLNSTQNTAILVDPTIPAQISLPSALPTGNKPVAVDIDPGTNQAIIVNQTDGTATIFSLGALRPLQITDVSPSSYAIQASLTVPAVATDQVVTITGKGFTSSSIARLDGIPLTTLSVSDRVMKVDVPASMISTPHILALDVLNPGPIVSNAEDFTVVETVDVTGPSCAQPAPAGVALDTQNNLVVASLSGCNTLAVVNLSTGTGQTVSVGTFPTGVAVMPNMHLAAVANEGSGNVSIVDTIALSVTQTESTSAGPVGVAMDPNTQEVAVACSTAGTINLFNAITPGTATSMAVDEFPVSVAIDPLDNLVASANAEGNDVSIVDELDVAPTIEVSGMQQPTNVVYDPSTDEFLASSSLSNQSYVVAALTGSSSPVKVGINPTAIAYNSLSSTMVTANTTSGTMTVVDFLARRIRGVVDLSVAAPGSPYISPQVSSSQGFIPTFSVDVHQLANLAVVADTTNNRLVIVPLPR